MYFKDKLDSINAHICICVPEFRQYCQNSGKTNLHAKSSIAVVAAILIETVAAIYCQKACISIRVVSSLHALCWIPTVINQQDVSTCGSQ